MGGGGGVPRAPRSRGTGRAGARWLPRRPRQERRCTAAGPGPVRPPPRSPGGFSGPGPPGPRGVVLLQGPVASHLPGGRSAATPPPYRSPDPSSARRPGGCRAGGIIAIAAAAAHPGSRGKPGRGGAGTETPRAPPPTPRPDTPARRPACPRALDDSRASRCPGARPLPPLQPPSSAPREVSGAPFCRSGSGGSPRLLRADAPRKRGSGLGGEEGKGGGTDGHSATRGGLGP